MGLKTDVSEESSILDKLVSIIEELEGEYDQLIIDPSQYREPHQKAMDHLVHASVFLIKSPKIDKILDTWHKSELWRIKAYRFLQDKLNEE